VHGLAGFDLDTEVVDRAALTGILEENATASSRLSTLRASWTRDMATSAPVRLISNL
jgi:hypothetical protein